MGFNDAPGINKKVIDLEDVKIDPSLTIDGFRSLYRELPNPKDLSVNNPGYQDYRRMSPRHIRILELWRKKFLECFDTASSTEERLRIIKEGKPPYSHMSDDTVLEDNALARDRAVLETIKKIANIEELTLVREYIRGDKGSDNQKDERERDNYSIYSALMKRKKELA